MRTIDFEQNLLSSLNNVVTKHWIDFFLQKHKIRLLRKTGKTTYANKQYSKLAVFEVPILNNEIVVMTVGQTGKQLEFHYFGFEVDQNSNENLNDLYEKHLMMSALRGKNP